MYSNKLLTHLNYELIRDKNVSEEDFITVWRFFYSHLLTVNNWKSLKFILSKNLKNTFEIFNDDPVRYSSLFFDLQLFVLDFLVDCDEKGKISQKDFLLLFDDFLVWNVDFFNRVVGQSTICDNFFRSIGTKIENCFFYIVKICIKLTDSVTIYNSLFDFINSYCKLVRRFNIELPQSFIFFFDLTVNTKLESVLESSKEQSMDKTLLFVLLANLISFMKIHENLQLLYAHSDFYGEQPSTCGRLVENVLELFGLLMKDINNAEEKSIVERLEGAVLDIINNYLSSNNEIVGKGFKNIDKALLFIEEASSALEKEKRFKKFIDDKYGNEKDKNPLLLYYMDNKFEGIILTSLIGGEDEKSRGRLNDYLNLFDFKGLTVLEALREFFLVFQMKGETQVIERILEGLANKHFTENYCQKEKEEEDKERRGPKSSDDIFTLMFAFLMLNTDRHSEEVKEKMNFEGFLKNVRYIADETVINEEEVRIVFESIRDSEIKFFESEKLKRKPEIFSLFDWQFVVGNKEKVRKRFLKDFLPKELYLSISNRLSDKTVIDDFIDFKLRKLFEFKFFDNLPLVFKSNTYNYEMLDLILQFFRENSGKTVSPKLAKMIEGISYMNYEKDGKTELWNFECIFVLLANLAERHEPFIENILTIFFNNFKTIYFKLEDHYLNNVFGKIRVIGRNRKDILKASKGSKTIGKIFNVFSFDSSEDELLRETNEKKEALNKKETLKYKNSKNLINRFLTDFPKDPVFFSKFLKSFFDYFSVSCENANVRRLVAFLHMLKQLALNAKNAKMLINFCNLLLSVKELNIEIARKPQIILEENIRYLLITTLIYLRIVYKEKELNLDDIEGDQGDKTSYVFVETPEAKTTSFFVSEENIDYGSDFSANKVEIKETTFNSDIKEDKSLINLNATDFLKESEKEVNSYLDQVSRKVFNLIVEEINETLRLNKRINTQQFVIFVNHVFDNVINKYKQDENDSLNSNVQNFIIKSVNRFIKENIDEAIFYVFKIVDGLGSTFDIDIYSVYYPIVDEIRNRKNLSEASKNKLLFLTFEKLDFEIVAKKNKRYIKTLLGLVNSIIRLIEYKEFDIEKAEFIISGIEELTKIVEEDDIENYEELINCFHYILMKNACKLFIGKILKRFVCRYVQITTGFIRRNTKEKEVVG